eukprot:6005163-Pyramimonas_sp.AAC.1
MTLTSTAGANVGEGGGARTPAFEGPPEKDDDGPPADESGEERNPKGDRLRVPYFGEKQCSTHGDDADADKSLAAIRFFLRASLPPTP